MSQHPLPDDADRDARLQRQLDEQRTGTGSKPGNPQAPAGETPEGPPAPGPAPDPPAPPGPGPAPRPGPVPRPPVPGPGRPAPGPGTPAPGPGGTPAPGPGGFDQVEKKDRDVRPVDPDDPDLLGRPGGAEDLSREDLRRGF